MAEEECLIGELGTRSFARVAAETLFCDDAMARDENGNRIFAAGLANRSWRTVQRIGKPTIAAHNPYRNLLQGTPDTLLKRSSHCLQGELQKQALIHGKIPCGIGSKGLRDGVLRREEGQIHCHVWRRAQSSEHGTVKFQHQCAQASDGVEPATAHSGYKRRKTRG